MNKQIVVAPDGLRGIDCNTTVGPRAAALFLQHDYRFAVRYVSRVKRAPIDISPEETDDILTAGLGLQLVQHVANEGWIPSGPLGSAYGAVAASEATAAGFIPGGMLSCDLEGVGRLPGESFTDLSAATMAFLREWYAPVYNAGFEAGLYVGWHCRLTPDQLYELPFKRYWGAYNTDTIPSSRGFQQQQREYPGSIDVPGISFQFDIDTIEADAMGDTPTLMVATGWAP